VKLTPHFSLEEFVASEVAARAGIDNTPSVEIVANLQRLARYLEVLRGALQDLPIHVTSGYRCLELNQRIGGARNSAHIQGWAADIVCPEFGTPLEVCWAVAKSGLPFDQVIHEFGRWCHVAIAPPEGTPRGELLTIRSVATGYELGLRT
jgi:hypothetical protein